MFSGIKRNLHNGRPSTLFRSNGKPVSASAAPRLISDMSKQSPCDLAPLFDIYNHLSSPPNIAVFGALISACKRANQPQKALGLLFDLERYSININSTVFYQLLGACKDSPVSQSRGAAAKLAQMWNTNPQLSDRMEGACVLLMKELARHDDFASIWDCYQTLCKHAVPSLGVIGMLAVACAKGSPKRIGDIVAEIRKYQISLDRGCFVAIAQACGKSKNLELARWLFQQLAVTSRGPLEYAQLTKVFVDLGSLDDAMKLLQFADNKRVVPNVHMYTSLLAGCANFTSLDSGNIVLKHLESHGVTQDVMIQNAAIRLFARCADFEEAASRFHKMNERGFKPDAVSWNIMINMYGIFGLGKEAEEIFHRMVACGHKPDSITFTCLLSAFAHSKMVDKALEFYLAMELTYAILPTNHHHSCVVDALARSGKLKEAEIFLNDHIQDPDIVTLTTLFGACRVYGDVDRAERIGERAIKLDPSDPSLYVLLYNTYASAGLHDKAASVRARMEANATKKIPGQTWITIEGKVHTFIMEESTHPLIKEINNLLEVVASNIKELGYSPDLSVVLQQVPEERKVQLLWQHSEKLAVALGLLKTPPHSKLIIKKNLRMCGDCHNAFKFISKVYNREIYVRDSKRYHVFRNGTCTCNDFW